MQVKNLIDTFFRSQHNIDRILYDPQDVDLDPNDDSQNIRKVFEIMKKDPMGGSLIYDKCADGAGHYNDCPWYVIEVTASDIRKAIVQIKSTLKYIYGKGDRVRNIAILLDENRWNDRLARSIYKIERDLLFKRRKTNNESITISHNGETLIFDINCYLVDFEKYGGVI